MSKLKKLREAKRRHSGELEMKKFLLGTVGLLALGLASAPASAADLAARPYTKAPPMMQPMYDWSGFYIGINGGWAQANDGRSNVSTQTPLGSYDTNGGTIGGQVGYRWQNGNFVFGLEAQGNWADLTGSSQNLSVNNTLRSKMDAFGLFTGQVGYAWNNVLLYAKGGAAVTDRNYEFISNVTGTSLASAGYNTEWSPTVGVGLEYGFAPNWSFGVEYDHIFEDRHNVSFNSVATGLPLTNTYSSGGDTDMVLGRLNYKFGYGAPLLAKY
jgi:outer membrane immunogenic protein